MLLKVLHTNISISSHLVLILWHSRPTKCVDLLALLLCFVTNDAIDEMQPFMGGGDMIETVSIHGSTFQSNEHKFEAGTQKLQKQ